MEIGPLWTEPTRNGVDDVDTTLPRPRKGRLAAPLPRPRDGDPRGAVMGLAFPLALVGGFVFCVGGPAAQAFTGGVTFGFDSAGAASFGVVEGFSWPGGRPVAPETTLEGLCLPREGR